MSERTTKDKLTATLIRDLSHQIKEQEGYHKDEIGYLDFASWGYEQGVLLTVRQAQLILTILKEKTK